MEICAYYQYKVTKQIKSSYIDDENSLPDDYAYKENDFINTLNYNGGELLEMVAKALSDDDCMDFRVEGNLIIFDYFNPMNGTGKTEYWKINAIDDERYN